MLDKSSDKIFRQRNELDNHIYEVCESTYHECSAKYETESYKEDGVVEKADLIIKKDSEHKEITRKKENLTIWRQFWKGHGSQ